MNYPITVWKEGKTDRIVHLRMASIPIAVPLLARRPKRFHDSVRRHINQPKHAF